MKLKTSPKQKGKMTNNEKYRRKYKRNREFLQKMQHLYNRGSKNAEN